MEIARACMDTRLGASAVCARDQACLALKRVANGVDDAVLIA